jgi:transposase
MAKGYIPVNRDQQFLFPPDIRDWLGKDHFVWWLLDVVAGLDTKELHKLRRRGAQGRTGYDPDMLLALLLYAYTHKVRSSREIERLCQTDVAFRVICGGNFPDHTTIARFRQDQAPLCGKLFAQVLELCAAAGLAQVGVVALDGTKLAANASKGANRSRAQLEAQRAKLEAEIQEMFAQAQAADDDEDERFGPPRGDELPAGLASAAGRKAAIDAALAALAEREGRHRPNKPQVWRARAGRYEQALPAARAAWAAHQATKCPTGRPPRYPQGQQVARLEAKLARAQAKAAAAGQAAANRAQVNLTDPDSRLMPTPGGWAQAYNAQAVVNYVGIILAAEVSCDPGDMALFRPMVARLAQAGDVIGPVGVVLADAGYCSEANLAAPGPVRLIAVKKDRRTRADRATTSGPAPAGLSRRAAMEHAMRTPEGRHLYKQRSWTVEPSFGNLKHNMGFSRFSRRGREAAGAEWHLVTAGANLLKLFRYYPAAVRVA